MIFKNINSEDISGLIICSEPPISSSAIRTKETTIDGRDGAIVEKLGYKTRIRNVEIGLKKDANVDKILSYFSGEGDLIFKNENDKVYKAAIYEQVDLERLLRLRKGSVAFYCQPFKYKRNDIFETIKDNKVKEKKGKHLELLNCAEQNVVDLKLEGSTNQATRSGKNKFNPNNPTYSNSATAQFANDTITISSTATNTTPCIRWEFETPEDKIYIIRCSGILLTSEAQIVIGYNNGSKWIYPGISAQYIDGIKNEKIVFSAPKEVTKVGVLLYSTKEIPTTKSSAKYKNIIVTIDNDDMSYEQYGASPSPDYPSEIENVEGKNIFDNKHPTAISQGAIWQPTETGGKYSTTVNWKKIEWRFKLDTSKTYTFHYKARNSSTLYLYIKTFTDNTYSTEKTSIIANGTATSETFTPDTQYVLIKFDNSAVEADVLIEELQLEEGTVATPYVPYNSLEFKVEGKNLFDVTLDSSITNKIQYKTYKLEPNTKYTISTNTYLSNDVIANIFIDLGTSLTPSTLTNGVNGSKTITTDSTGYVTIGYRNNSMQLDYSTGMYYCQLEKGQTATDYEPYKSQVVTFPLGEEKLMEGSYLADDGIHHKRKQYTFTGNETVNITTYGDNKRFTVVPSSYNPSYKGQDTVGLCNYLKRDYMGTVGNATLAQEPCFFIHPSGILITMTPDTNIVNETQLKTWLATQYANGTPVIVEYELAEPETVPYTAEQQEAYNQLQKLKLYKGQNTMFSLEGSIINLKYLEDTDEKVENQGNIYSKPIIRLEKTVFKEVEIAINGIRFKYNFEEDDYVEIDCEEMTVQYEGLDRNRRLVIDFEFPKLKEGNNDIVMYSGDCIIKCKRKDRWL